MSTNAITQEEKKVLRSMFWRSHLTFIAFNMVKMEANGFTTTMQPAIESIYKDDPEGKKEAYLRHQNFFNTNAVPFAFIAGLSYALEKEKKEKGVIDGATINSIKVGLMGPTAGMFDSLFFNGLRIIAAGIGIGFNSQGNFLGTLLFILLYGFTQSIAKYFLLNWGYSAGTTAIDQVFSSGLMKALTRATSILGLMMVGALVAQMVNVPLNWTITISGAKLVIQDVLNNIFPGMLSIGLVFGLVAMIKKGWRPLYLVFGILILGLLGALINIF
jgi:mannose/fructose/N-acetylgalactosamine-specific phosphotransferase system component IID